MIVVGGGAMGLSTAWWLARGGRSVVLLERFERGHVRGSSHGSARVFRLAYPDSQYVDLAVRAQRLWAELESESGTSLLTRTGGIDMGHPKAVRDVAMALDRSSVPYEFMDPSAGAERYSGMRFETPLLYQSEGGRLDAELTLTTLQTQAEKHGAAIKFSEGLEAIEAKDDRLTVSTSQDTYRAPVGVFAVGSWITPILGPHLALPPIRISKEQPAHFTRIDEAAVWPIFLDHTAARSAAGPANFAAYGLNVLGGVKVGLHGTGLVVDPETRDFEPDQRGLDDLSRYVEHWLPGLDPTPHSITSCLYTSTSTTDFILDRRGPFVVGSACSGHGFKFTPVIGQILAGLAEGESSPNCFWI